MIDAELDEIARSTTKGIDFSRLPRPDIHNGYYTLTFPCGSHRTFRLHTQVKGKLSGRRIIGMLIGPDNTNDYESFAYLDHTGIQVWKRFKNADQARYASLLWRIWNHEIIDGHELLESRRCLKCNRTLTDPLSHELGIGPTCRSK